MEISLYKNQFPQGTKYSIKFIWDSAKFVIRTYEKEYVVQDSEIVKKDGKYYFNPSKQNPRYTSIKIEIPKNVIDRKNKLDIDLRNRKGSIANVAHTSGKIYFSLNEAGQLITKLGDTEAIADEIEMIENKKAINIESLGLEFPFLEVPAKVETAFMKAKHDKIMLNCRLIYSGNSLLTGKEYYKLNHSVPPDKRDCIEDFFDDFGSGSGRTGELTGWLTSQPEKVENALGIKHAVSDRKGEIEKHENEARIFENASVSIQK